MAKFIDKLKKGAATLIQKGNDYLDEKPALYIAINTLRIELGHVALGEHADDIKAAAKQLESLLADALRKYDNTPGLWATAYLKEDCSNAILTYQRTLMTEPGLWNHLQAFINDVLEYLNIEPVFTPEKSSLALDTDFSPKFFSVKKEMKEIDEKLAAINLENHSHSKAF